VLNAVGGSTNAVIHLTAIAGRLGLHVELDALDRLGRDVPLLADVEPSGSRLIGDFDAAGGVPALLRQLSPLLDLDARLGDGRSVGEVAGDADEPRGPALRRLDEPLATGGAFRVVRGNLAPGGAVVKRSAASPSLLAHRGPAVVFSDYDDMRRRVEEPDLEADETSVLVLAGCGPVGGLGMPEWGMVPIPRQLVERGVRDMVRVTDARMSGTSYGTVVLHVAPEAAAGGTIGLVRDGDLVELDADAGRLELLVDDDALEARRSAAGEPAPAPGGRRHRRGWPALYQQHVMQAPDGCDLDFLRPVEGRYEPMVEPVVGRS